MSAAGEFVPWKAQPYIYGDYDKEQVVLKNISTTCTRQRRGSSYIDSQGRYSVYCQIGCQYILFQPVSSYKNFLTIFVCGPMWKNFLKQKLIETIVDQLWVRKHFKIDNFVYRKKNTSSSLDYVTDKFSKVKTFKH